MNGWFDYSDLQKLQSIHLFESAIYGDWRDEQKTISDEPYNYNNTLTMRSDCDYHHEWIDLPSLTTFNGNGTNFYTMGSVVLESNQLGIG